MMTEVSNTYYHDPDDIWSREQLRKRIRELEAERDRLRQSDVVTVDEVLNIVGCHTNSHTFGIIERDVRALKGGDDEES